MKFGGDSTHFKAFVSVLTGVIAGYDTDEEHYVRQKRQVETLAALENKFRDVLVRDCRGPAAYKAFVRYIRDERKNILSARPYFRERQTVFKEKIAPLLHQRKDKSLYQFHINYNFISFVLRMNKFGPNSKVVKIARQVEAIRKELIEMNIPLAISRARVFSYYSQAHLEYMDLVQVATEGLVAAIDKFVGPYQKTFGAVMYGRITGDLVEANSETLLHFFPSDRRLIYTINKLMKEGKSFEEITEHINTEFRKDKTGKVDRTKPLVTNVGDVQQLHVAAYHVSADAQAPVGNSESDSGTLGGSEPAINRFEADASWRPDVRVEETQVRNMLSEAISKLSLFERKLLKMKGIEL